MAEKPTLGHWIAIGVLVFLQAVPVLAVALNGFATNWAGTILPEGYTLKWVDTMLADPRFLASVEHSLIGKVAQQMLRRARVLGRDHIDLAENAQRAQGDVLEVPDRRCDDVERSSHPESLNPGAC